MQDNFNLSKFLRTNPLLNENLGGYIDLKPINELGNTGYDTDTDAQNWYYDDTEKTEEVNELSDEDFFGDEPEEMQNVWMEDVKGKQINDWTCFYQEQVGSIGLESDRFPGISLYATPGFEGANGIVFEAWNEEGDNIDLNTEDPKTNQYVAGKSFYADFDSYADDMENLLPKIESMLQGGEAMNELEKPEKIYADDATERDYSDIEAPRPDSADYDRMFDHGGDQIEKGIMFLLDDGFDPEDVLEMCKMFIDAHSK